MKKFVDNIISSTDIFRVILWFPVIFGCGIALYFAMPHQLSTRAIGSLFILPLWAIFILRHFLYKSERGSYQYFLINALRILFLIIAIMASGFAMAKLRSLYVDAPVIDNNLGTVWVRADIEKMEIREKGTRIYLINNDLWTPETGAFASDKTPYRMRVNVMTSIADDVHIGDHVQFKARLNPPNSKPVYPGGYDFARRAYFERIGAVGFAVSKVRLYKDRYGKMAPPNILERAGQYISDLRFTITERITNALDGKPSAAVASALLTGHKGAIPKEVSADMRQSGLGHLLAISGLHMSIVMMGIFVIVRLLLVLMPYIALRINVKKWSAIAAIIAGLIYLMISGQPVSAFRAYIMACMFFVAILIGRINTSMRLVALAAFVVLLFNPEAIYGPSFQMSFAAVVALIAFFEKRENKAGQRMLPSIYDVIVGNQYYVGQKNIYQKSFLYLSAIILSSLVAGCATAPFAVYHFGHYANYGILANLIAIPITTLFIMPLGIISLVLMLVGGEFLTLIPMGIGIDIVVKYAGFINGLPGSSIKIAMLDIWAIALFTLAGLWLCIWQGKWRIYAIPIMIASLVISLYSNDLPDIIVGEKGLFAVRGADDKLYFSSFVKGRYARSQWLQKNGQIENIHVRDWNDNDAYDVTFFCDHSICQYSKNGYDITFIADIKDVNINASNIECEDIDLLINMVDEQQYCAGVKTISTSQTQQFGTHIISLKDEIIIENVDG